MNTKIILVDDQRVYRDLFRDLIGEWFDLAAVVNNYDEALVAVERLRPAAVVVDVNLEGGPGGRNGFQLADALLRIEPALQIILVSAYAEPAYAHLARALPRTTFVDKAALTSDKLKDILMP